MVLDAHPSFSAFASTTTEAPTISPVYFLGVAGAGEQGYPQPPVAETFDAHSSTTSGVTFRTWYGMSERGAGRVQESAQYSKGTRTCPPSSFQESAPATSRSATLLRKPSRRSKSLEPTSAHLPRAPTASSPQH